MHDNRVVVSDSFSARERMRDAFVYAVVGFVTGDSGLSHEYRAYALLGDMVCLARGRDAILNAVNELYAVRGNMLVAVVHDEDFLEDVLNGMFCGRGPYSSPIPEAYEERILAEPPLILGGLLRNGRLEFIQKLVEAQGLHLVPTASSE